MEVQQVERCCCVVKVSEAWSANKSVSCSGVLVHPPTGTVICTSLPFSRFITEGGALSSDRRFLSRRSFSRRLRIRVSLSTQRDLDANQCAEAGTYAPSRSTTSRRTELSAELLMLVNCPEFRQAFQAVFQEADKWRFHGEEEDAELIRDAQFLSWFAVLKTDVGDDSRQGAGTISWQSSSSLQKGCPVLACGTPFGSLCQDLFTCTLSRGIVSNLAGEDNAVILTDARCLPGTEGGGLFAVGDASDGVRLAGLIVSPFGWKDNEWIGLSLVCSIQLIFRNLIGCTSEQHRLRDVWLSPEEVSLHKSNTALELKAGKYPTVCFVDSGQFWGSGVLVASHLVVTCRHVVNGKSRVHLKFHHRDRTYETLGDVLFSTKASSPYDLAVVQLRDCVPGAVVPQLAHNFLAGQSVVVVGYGGLGRRCGPSLTRGVLSKTINSNHQPIMLQTTCAVQAGASGGAVVQAQSGELLGIVSSNTKDLAANVTYPHLNFSIPVPVFQKLLQHFRKTDDVNVFRVLDTTEKEVRRVWRLQGTHSKL